MKTTVFSIMVGGLPIRWISHHGQRVPVLLCEDKKSVRMVENEMDSLLLLQVLEAAILGRKNGEFFGTSEQAKDVIKTEMELVNKGGAWCFINWADIIFLDASAHWTKHIEEQLIIMKQGLLKRLLPA